MPWLLSCPLSNTDGGSCYKYLENFPPMTVGAWAGGEFYFAMIIFVQTVGILSSLIFIRRMVKRHLMPRKELFVLGMALVIELVGQA